MASSKRSNNGHDKKYRVGTFARYKVDSVGQTSHIGVIQACWEEGNGVSAVLIRRFFRSHEVPKHLLKNKSNFIGDTIPRNHLVFTNSLNAYPASYILETFQVKLKSHDGNSCVLLNADEEADEQRDEDLKASAVRFECSTSVDDDDQGIQSLSNLQLAELRNLVFEALVESSSDSSSTSTQEDSELTTRPASSRKRRHTASPNSDLSVEQTTSGKLISDKRGRVQASKRKANDALILEKDISEPLSSPKKTTDDESDSSSEGSTERVPTPPGQDGVIKSKTRPTMTQARISNGMLRNRTKPRIHSGKYQAVIPSLISKPSPSTHSTENLLWSPANTIAELDFIREKSKMQVTLASKPGAVVPIQIALGSNEYLFWARIVKPVNEHGHFSVIPYDAAWPKRADDPASLDIKDQNLVVEVDMDHLVLPNNLEEQLMYHLFTRERHFQISGVGDILAKWSEKEYDSFCIAQRAARMTGASTAIKRIANAVGKSKTKQDVLDLLSIPRAGMNNAALIVSAACSMCRCRPVAQVGPVLVCKRYFSCKIIVCRKCFYQYSEHQNKHSLTAFDDHDPSFDLYQRSCYSQSWICTKCQTCRFSSSKA